jgi:hypothetical protein
MSDADFDLGSYLRCARLARMVAVETSLSFADALAVVATVERIGSLDAIGGEDGLMVAINNSLFDIGATLDEAVDALKTIADRVQV